MANLSVLYSSVVIASAFLHAGTPGITNQGHQRAALLSKTFAARTFTSGDEQSAMQRFVGTWVGKCQDGRTFVIVALKQDGKQLGGTVSIGNMHGDDEGACMLVLAPPAPEHAQRISDAVARQDVLSFNGTKHPDGSFARFELALTENGVAQLKLMGSPVEHHPWPLVKTSNAN